MDGDETTILGPGSIAQADPPKINWVDWRSQHGLVFVARRGDDGDGASWEATWKVYGLECFDAMYRALLKVCGGKPIYLNQAIKWLEQNTKDVPDGQTASK